MSAGPLLVLGSPVDPGLGHKLEVMTSGGPLEHEDVQAWRTLAEAEITRLASLTGPELGAEVMDRGFAELPADGERTRIGLSNSLCPAAPPVLGGDDIDVVTRYSELLIPVLDSLEVAELLQSETRGRSALRFYSATARGRSALEDNGIEAILATRA